MQGTRNTLICRLLLGAGIFVYLATLVIAIIGTQGLFGATPDGLAAVFLIFAGLPWSLLATPLVFFEFPLWIGQAWVVLSPLITLYVIWRLCSRTQDEP